MEPGDTHTQRQTSRLGEGLGSPGSPSPDSSAVRLSIKSHRLLKHLDQRQRAQAFLTSSTKAYRADGSDRNRRRLEHAVARAKKAEHRVARSTMRLREAVEEVES
jgi:hypothetical protein